jgi:hypothetical protein
MTASNISSLADNDRPPIVQRHHIPLDDPRPERHGLAVAPEARDTRIGEGAGEGIFPLISIAAMERQAGVDHFVFER